ncbi:MAG: hypothetical protein V9G21_05355 [Methylotenera sp.]
MLGLFVLGILGLWLWFAIWLAKKLNNYLWRKADAQPTNVLARKITAVLLTMLVILLPFIDQIIAYPKWQQMCATTGDFEWGPNMDEKKAFGREVTLVNERVTTTTIFPNIKVDYSGWYVYDSKTQELIFKKPHYQYSAAAFLYLPSDSGNKTALFLPTCKNYAHFLKSDDILKKLNLTVVNDKQVLK